MLSPETIKAIQETASIEEVIGEFITLKKKGQNLWACCPFHNEKTPSFAVSPHKGFYKCFGCEASGNVINFVQAIQGIGFIEAVKYLGLKYNIPFEEIDTMASEEVTRIQREKESLYIVMQFAQNYYKSNLLQHAEGKRLGYSYLQQRNVDEACLHTFNIGYSLEGWTGLFTYAQQQGFSKEVLEQAGLLVENQEKIYDRFRGRIMFPIHNLAGQTIAFAARTLGSVEHQPKYINSPDTAIYQKGHVVYGLYQAKPAVRQAGHCFLVEGYTDVMALHQAGIKNVVASAGTALTSAQIDSIGRLTKDITILFDGDSAGIQATLRGVDKILEKGLTVKTILLPPGEDPDSYTKKMGTMDLKDYLKNHEEDFITFKTNLLLAEAGNDLGKRATVIKQVLQTIALVPDVVYKTLLLKQSSKILEIDENVLISEHNRLHQGTQKGLDRELERRITKKLQLSAKDGAVIDHNWSDIIQAYEQESMRLLLNYGHIILQEGQPLCQYLLQELADVTFQHPLYRQMRMLYEEKLAQEATVDIHLFLQHPEDSLRNTAMHLMISPYVVSEHWHEKYQIHIPKEADDLHTTIYKNVLRLKLRLIHQLIDTNQQLLKSNIGYEEEEDKLLKVHTSLKAAEIQITKELGIVVIR